MVTLSIQEIERLVNKFLSENLREFFFETKGRG